MKAQTIKVAYAVTFAAISFVFAGAYLVQEIKNATRVFRRR